MAMRVAALISRRAIDARNVRRAIIIRE